MASDRPARARGGAGRGRPGGRLRGGAGGSDDLDLDRRGRCPPQIAAGNGRVFLPYGKSRDTAAFFDITNIGGADDQLTGVTSPAVEDARLSRHRSSGLGADTMGMTGSVRISAGGTLTMSPFDVSVMARTRTGWKAGDIVPFVLHFRHSPPVTVMTVVVRPSS
ncbi:copper chaperone PCu(A)C [Streptomyces sp. NPDC088748]|uniref:copper chaperone PCu(A)C n=1 Tax=Streptomyces sp. NPDC088748 TaxID=3365887 RepID=UPI003809D436